MHYVRNGYIEDRNSFLVVVFYQRGQPSNMRSLFILPFPPRWQQTIFGTLQCTPTDQSHGPRHCREYSLGRRNRQPQWYLCHERDREVNKRTKGVEIVVQDVLFSTPRPPISLSHILKSQQLPRVGGSTSSCSMRRTRPRSTGSTTIAATLLSTATTPRPWREGGLHRW